MEEVAGHSIAEAPGLVDRYLARLGLAEPPPQTVDGLQQLMVAHLVSVPFENLDVYWQTPVATDAGHSVAKILDRCRGGWCFELNGAFARLLVELGYSVRLLGAAVLLGGPNKVVDHLTLEVDVEGAPHLVDVGFGDGFARPLPLNSAPEQRIDAVTGTYGFMPSSQGTTLVRHDSDGGGPAPQYRFRRVSLTLEDLSPASDALYHNDQSNFRKGPLATRLTGDGATRVTLTTDRLRFSRPGEDGAVGAMEDRPVEQGSADWFELLEEWFGIGVHNLPPAAHRHETG